MTRRTYQRILLLLMFLVPAAVAAWWWYYWPIYHLRDLRGRAERAIAEDNLPRADESLARLTQEYPDDLRGHFLYAQILRRLGRVEAADKHLGEAARLGLSQEEGRREFGLLYADVRFSLAVGALEQALKADPDDVEVLRALAIGYAQNSRWAESERCFDRLEQLQPERNDVQLLRGHLYMDRDQFEKAAGLFRGILRRSPGNFTARLLLAHCLLAEAHLGEAEPELLACRQMRPDTPEPLLGLATCAQERGDNAKALTLLGQAYELDPGSVAVLIELGNLQLQNGRADLALPWFEQILRLEPDNRQAHLKMAQVLRQLGKADAAKEHERRYQELPPQVEKSRHTGVRP